MATLGELFPCDFKTWYEKHETRQRLLEDTELTEALTPEELEDILDEVVRSYQEYRKSIEGTET